MQAVTNHHTTSSYLPSEDTVRQSLVFLNFATSIVASIPPVRVIGSLIQRSVAAATAIHSLNTERSISWVDISVKTGKLGVVALGLAAVAASVAVLAVAALASDMAIQIFSTFKALSEREWHKASMHLSAALVDGLTFAAILTGGWQWVVSASVVSFVSILILSVYAIKQYPLNDQSIGSFIEFMSRMGQGALAAFHMAHAIGGTNTNGIAHYRSSDKDIKEGSRVDFYNRWGKLVASSKAGAPIEFTKIDMRGNHYGGTDYVSEVWYNSQGQRIGEVRLQPFRYSDQILWNPIKPELIPTLPIGGSAIVEVFPEYDLDVILQSQNHEKLDIKFEILKQCRKKHTRHLPALLKILSVQNAKEDPMWFGKWLKEDIQDEKAYLLLAAIWHRMNHPAKPDPMKIQVNVEADDGNFSLDLTREELSRADVLHYQVLHEQDSFDLLEKTSSNKLSDIGFQDLKQTFLKHIEEPSQKSEVSARLFYRSADIRSFFQFIKNPEAWYQSSQEVTPSVSKLILEYCEALTRPLIIKGRFLSV